VLWVANTTIPYLYIAYYVPEDDVSFAIGILFAFQNFLPLLLIAGDFGTIIRMAGNFEIVFLIASAMLFVAGIVCLFVPTPPIVDGNKTAKSSSKHSNRREVDTDTTTSWKHSVGTEMTQEEEEEETELALEDRTEIMRHESLVDEPEDDDVVETNKKAMG